MENHISVLLTKEELEEGYYMSIFGCPLANALRLRGYKDVAVGGREVDIQGNHYCILEENELMTMCAPYPHNGKPEVTDLEINLLLI